MSSLPKVLVDNIKEGNVVLFLGAGASIGAEHPQKRQIPNGKELAKMLVEKFLGSEYHDIPLLRCWEAYNLSRCCEQERTLLRFYQEGRISGLSVCS